MEATGSKDRGVRLTYSRASTPLPIESQASQYPSVAFAGGASQAVKSGSLLRHSILVEQGRAAGIKSPG
jgi:hypothetical protein